MSISTAYASVTEEDGDQKSRRYFNHQVRPESTPIDLARIAALVRDHAATVLCPEVVIRVRVAMTPDGNGVLFHQPGKIGDKVRGQITALVLWCHTPAVRREVRDYDRLAGERSAQLGVQPFHSSPVQRLCILRGQPLAAVSADDSIVVDEVLCLVHGGIRRLGSVQIEGAPERAAKNPNTAPLKRTPFQEVHALLAPLRPAHLRQQTKVCTVVLVVSGDVNDFWRSGPSAKFLCSPRQTVRVAVDVASEDDHINTDGRQHQTICEDLAMEV